MVGGGPAGGAGTENRGGGESMGSEGGAGCPVSPIPAAWRTRRDSERPGCSAARDVCQDSRVRSRYL